jgi:hypothetical protein
LSVHDGYQFQQVLLGVDGELTKRNFARNFFWGRRTHASLLRWFNVSPTGDNNRRSEMASDRSTTLERDETASLIASDKVEGTPVYGADGKRVGKIDRLMIDKISGKVAYAVTSFGGFLGIGSDHFPIPWPLLKYNGG